VLIRFEAANYRSIAEPVELSMVAIDRDRDAARSAPHLGESLLTLAAIFGPTASGKSNVVGALAWLRDAVQDSLRCWEDEIPLEPFAFAAGPGQTSEFVVESTVDGIRFEYVVELTRERIHYEGLFHYPQQKRRRIYEREGNDLRLQRGLGGLSGIRRLLTDRTLALSIARRFDQPLVNRFATDIAHIQTLPGRFDVDIRATMRWFENAPPHRTGERDQALAMLRLADLGIEDVLVEHREVGRRLRLLHKTGDQTVPLEFSAESAGTRNWFRLIGPLCTALHNGTIMIFDELDASLHPTLLVELLRIFHDPALNPRGAQLIFTSHDTSLLNHLNRDEIWLTEKRQNGSTRLGALAEFAEDRGRSSRNLENAYLHGRFGALPQVDQTGLLRALGLIG